MVSMAALRTVAGGLVAGLLLGILARAWMRLIATEPEFTWSGTIAIVVGFGIFGLTQGLAWWARRRSHGWRLSVARLLGVVGMLPLFVAAGAPLAPTVIFGGLAAGRTTWPRAARLALAALAAVPLALVAVGIVDDHRSSPLRAAVGVAGLLALYGLIVAVTAAATFAPRTDGYHLPRGVRLAGALAAAVPPVFVLAARGFS